MRYGSAFILLAICTIRANGQNDPLATPITIHLKQVPLDSALNIIDKLTPLAFAYNPDRLPLKAKINYKARAVSLRQVLNDLSNDGFFSFSLVERQIVLSRARKEAVFVVSGYIADGESGEALIGATVVADSLLIGGISNGYGFFSFRLPYGPHRLTSTYLGYEQSTTELDVSENQIISLQLNPAVSRLQEVVIHAGNNLEITATQMGKTRLSAGQIQQAPAAFGEYDIIKSLQYLPGITMQSEGSTFFFVRGGNKDQNLILIDDAPIYNPTHMLGLFSSLVPSTATSVEVFKSDFPLAKRGRLSSVIDIKTKEGNPKKLSGWGNIGLVSSQLGFSTPLKQDQSALLVSGRMSRLKWIFKNQINNLEQFRFYDLTTKVNHRFGKKDRVLASFYTSGDNFLTDTTGLGWSNLSGSVRWNHVISNTTFINTIIYGSNYEYLLHTDRTKNQHWRSRIGELGLKSDYTYFPRNNQELNFGLNITARTINPGNLISNDPVPEEYVVSVKNNLETAIYAEHDLAIGNFFGIKYGVRASLWTSLGEAFEFVYGTTGLPVDTLNYELGELYHNYFRLEPLITLKFKLGEFSNLKTGYTRTVQNLHQVSNTISPFTSFEVWIPSGPDILPQTADQVTISYDQLFADLGVKLRLEAYYKWLDNQQDIRGHARTLLNPNFTNELVFGKTRAFGTEIMLTKEEGRLRGIMAYSYGKAKSNFSEINNGITFNANTDRPHHANLNLNWDITRRISIGTNFSYTSGQPFSSPTAFYLFNNTEIPVYEKKNNDRFPDFHHLDISAQFKLNHNQDKRFQHNLTLGIYNIYGRKNPIFINFNKSLTDSQQIQVPTELISAQRISSRTFLYQVVPSINYQFRF